MTAVTEALQKLRAPFDDNQISYLPKGGAKLAYVGHAALTDRLLQVDPLWVWEPAGVDAFGLPMLDESGGLWIKLTVCGVTRWGYGDAGQKKGGDAMKERIGDALRNAGMRFGAALDLWHKGDLHGDCVPGVEPEAPMDMSPPARAARITAGVANGDAVAAAAALVAMPEQEMNAILALLNNETHDKVTAAWPA
jgi:hypothetical protein